MPTHPFQPSGLNADSKTLILGSFPSVASREMGFYYAHPQNRFWKVLGTLFDDKSIAQNLAPNPASLKHTKQKTITSPENQALINNIAAKTAFLQSHSLVLWDIVQTCEIIGSSDSSLKNIAFNDIFVLLSSSKIKTICLNGTKASALFQKYCKNLDFPLTAQTKEYYKILIPPPSFSQKFNRNISFFSLPSTSPTNAKTNLQKLLISWQILLYFGIRLREQ
ncbi:uracil-DNA glycosylase family protein [Helicobacter sp. MIT 05-5294]|uniref:uracil-DNA glycosylase family protein n=1 Tax=Helicobacter sp. MIT 05-5294 TaxID=1548150 RepID=UPI0010FD0C09|nr:uracil-DNA glycosylase family protein [Helicobacter sp. MIT 05-5294]TLD86574.1 uracil-DNA glycosylase family protein [Helicobacter sp. MIT 05-5294]